MELRQLLFGVRPDPLAAPVRRAGIAPGLYHYVREEGGAPVRLHLRVDRDGSGLLVAGASAAARLHPSGVIIAKEILEEQSDEAIVARLAAAFGGALPDRAPADVADVRRMIDGLLAPGETYPVVNLADPAFAPDAKHLEKPLSADVPLAPPERLGPVLRRLWDLAIPHVTLIAGEDPDGAALVRAVELAEDLGMIAGVRARGSQLTGGTLIRDLAQAGVDHVNVLYLAADAAAHDLLAGAGDHAEAVKALRAVREAEVCPVVETALVERTFERIEETIESLGALEVRNAGFYAIAMTPGKAPAGALRAEDLMQAAAAVEEAAAAADVRFLWYAPARFHLGRSLARLVARGPRCSGDTAVRVEPDGRVIAARGPYRAAGNVLTDSWERIARSPAMRRYRRRLERNTHCPDCPGLAICAADCPRDPEGWAEGEGREEGGGRRKEG